MDWLINGLIEQIPNTLFTLNKWLSDNLFIYYKLFIMGITLEMYALKKHSFRVTKYCIVTDASNSS